MPIINLALPETVEAVSRPIIFSILDHLRQILEISPDIQILFPGDLHKVAQAGATIDNPLRSPNLANDRYLFIEVDAQLDPNALATTAVHQNEHPPVFVDPKLDLVVAPIYATTDVSLNLRYRTPSRTDALRWYDDLRVRLSQMQDVHLHRVQYHYMLPALYWQILACVHATREATAGYGDDFMTYVREHSTDRLTWIGEVTGHSGTLAVAETQSRIQGRYGFDSLPDKPEREDNGTYTATFSYKFSFERPVSAYFRYPIMVHNQLLPPEYVLFTTSNTNANGAAQQYSRSIAALSHFEIASMGLQVGDLRGYLTVPLYDQFQRPPEVPYTGTVFYALCSIDPTDRVSLVNLNELAELQLDPDILQFIRESEYPYVHKLYKSVIQIHLYRRLTLAHYDTLQCDAALNIRAVQPLDLRIPHRVRFSLVTDWSVLDPEALARLRKYPWVLLKILRSIDELFDQNPYLFSLLGNRPRFNEREMLEATGHGAQFTEAGLLKLLSSRNLLSDKDLTNLMAYLQDKNADRLGNVSLLGNGSLRGHSADLLRAAHLEKTQFKSVCTSYIVSIRQDIAGSVTDAMIQ